MPRSQKFTEVISSSGALLTEEICEGISMRSTTVPCSDARASSGIKRCILLSIHCALHFLFDSCGLGAITTWRILKALSTATSHCFKKNKEPLRHRRQKQSSRHTVSSSCTFIIYLTTTLQEQHIFQRLQGLIILIPWSRSFQRGFSTACSFCRL